jgi:hypothetical protein
MTPLAGWAVALRGAAAAAALALAAAADLSGVTRQALRPADPIAGIGAAIGGGAAGCVGPSDAAQIGGRAAGAVEAGLIGAAAEVVAAGAAAHLLGVATDRIVDTADVAIVATLPVDAGLGSGTAHAIDTAAADVRVIAADIIHADLPAAAEVDATPALTCCTLRATRQTVRAALATDLVILLAQRHALRAVTTAITPSAAVRWRWWRRWGRWG